MATAIRNRYKTRESSLQFDVTLVFMGFGFRPLFVEHEGDGEPGVVGRRLFSAAQGKCLTDTASGNQGATEITNGNTSFDVLTSRASGDDPPGITRCKVCGTAHYSALNTRCQECRGDLDLHFLKRNKWKIDLLDAVFGMFLLLVRPAIPIWLFMRLTGCVDVGQHVR